LRIASFKLEKLSRSDPSTRLWTAHGRGLAVVALACLLVLTSGAGCEPSPPPEDKDVVGLADFHSHQFGGLGFGGKWITHSNDPTATCNAVLPFADDGNRVQDVVRKVLFEEARKQALRNECYPVAGDFVGQRYDTTNLKRAWSYGLRLIVMLALSNEYLCKVANLSDSPANVCPSDQQAIEEQFQAAKALEKQIDDESGGPGTGWYRIVRTPDEARNEISKGKLAVVLGTEAVNAFGCKIVARDLVAGIPDLFEQMPDEQTYQNSCPAAPFHPEYPTQRALALFEHYWNLGGRHFFPMHNMDGVAGGTALYVPLLHSDTYPTRLYGADLLNKVAAINRVIIAMRPPLQTAACAQFEFDTILTNRTAGRCNSAGLTDAGRALIRMMASYGAVIDIDHMSLKAKNEVLASDGPLGGAYPFVSSHGGAAAIGHSDKSSEGQLTDAEIAAMIKSGGAFAPVLPPASAKVELDTYPTNAAVATHDCGGTTESWVQAYRYFVDQLRAGTQLNGSPAYVGVGFGTDFSAPGSGGPLPRFVRSQQIVGESVTIVKGAPFVVGGKCYDVADSNSPRRLQYPFTPTSPLASRDPLEKSNVPWTGAKPDPYDISFDGLAHIGMIPDFVEELRTMQLASEDLDPLWHGAEAYIRTWEASLSWTGTFNEEDNKGIVATCSQLRADLLAVAGVGGNNQAAMVLDQLKQTGCHGY
jgi:microsomal dipeptidase-like Zn-dependent dipeptidase